MCAAIECIHSMAQVIECIHSMGKLLNVYIQQFIHGMYTFNDLNH